MKAAWIALVLWLGAGIAAAGGTGGRMGGGNWGSSSSGRSSSSSSSWGSSSSSSHSWSSPSSSSTSSHSWSSSGGWRSSTPSPSYTPSYTPSTSYTPSAGTTTTDTGGGYVPSYDSSSSSTSGWHDDTGFNFMFWTIALFIGVMFIGSIVKERWDNRDLVMGPDVPFDIADADVSVLRIAIDGRARKFLQDALQKLAAQSDTSTDAGRVQMLRDVTLLVRGVRDAWVYGGAVNSPMSTMEGAKSTFDRAVDEARSAFQHETISNEQGVRTTGASPGIAPRSEEGPGLVLVSIILAARTELYTVSSIGSGDDLRRALDAASHLGEDQLIAVEVVWQPSEDGDRLSSIELEAMYPRPALIPIQGALVGKTFCDHCGGPYPAELVSCPHCGAPSAHRAA